jgi:transcriptional regulator with XRE-family HTH domain
LDAVTHLEQAKPRSELGAFLRALRRRIDPNVRALGACVRLPSRIGKRVTQEELSEVIGVSREWYAMLESASAIRPSPGLLNRVADALMATPSERASLFALAVPELERPRLSCDSIAVLDSFTRLRSLTKQLWIATSVDEILAAASEQISTWFDSALLVHATRRHDSGLWERRLVDDAQGRRDAWKVIRDLEELFPTQESIDAINLFPRLSSAGEIGSADYLPYAVRRNFLKLCARRRVGAFTFIKTRVRSRTDTIAGLGITHAFGHSYSAADRAVMAAFAELTSLALS